ncbi:MAG: class I SAM-dependent methyltransferase [Chloroflexota bacterium]
MKQLQRSFGSQFARPHGPLGRLVAGMMRRGNAPLNLWMVDLLRVEPGDRILEIGFGPGIALAKLLDRTSSGFIAGVDVSGSMVKQAQSRHARDIAARRLEIRKSDARSLPYDDAAFDKTCGAHVIYFWPDPVETVRELRRVLQPGGTLALAYQERQHMPPGAITALTEAGARLVGPSDVEQVVRAAGFENVRLETRQTPDGPGGFCVLAVK